MWFSIFANDSILAPRTYWTMQHLIYYDFFLCSCLLGTCDLYSYEEYSHNGTKEVYNSSVADIGGIIGDLLWTKQTGIIPCVGILCYAWCDVYVLDCDKLLCSQSGWTYPIASNTAQNRVQQILLQGERWR